MAAMLGSVRKNPGGRYSDWLDSVEDDSPTSQSSTRVITAPLPRAVGSASATTTSPFGLRLDPRERGDAPAGVWRSRAHSRRRTR